MAEQWEMCMTYSGGLSIWSPRGSMIDIRVQDFANTNDIKLTKPNNRNAQENDIDVINYLLSNGWEPYTSHNNFLHFFKRKINS